MKRTHRINLIMLALVAVLGLAVYAQIVHETAALPPALTALDPAAITQLEIQCQHCSARRFQRGEQGWMMQQPYELAADDSAIERVLSLAAMQVRRTYDSSELDLAKIGLAPPLMSVQLDQLRIDIGLTDALQGDRYLRVGERIVMLPDRFSPLLMAAPESELDRRLLPRGSVLQQVRVNGVERADLRAVWSIARASGIVRAGTGIPLPNDAVTVELQRDGEDSVIYQLYRHGEDYRARRANLPLDWLLDRDLVQQLIGEDPAPANSAVH